VYHSFVLSAKLADVANDALVDVIATLADIAVAAVVALNTVCVGGNDVCQNVPFHV
jgi:hypothetical protein